MAAFGYGVGDCLAIASLAKQIIDACKDGPDEYHELHREVQSLGIAIQQLSGEASSPGSQLNRKGGARKADFDEIITNCKKAVQDIRDFVEKHVAAVGPVSIKKGYHAYKVGAEDLNAMRGKMVFWMNCIDLFLHSLDPATQARIERKLDLIIQKMGINKALSTDSLASVSSVMSFSTGRPDDTAWKLINTQLVSHGIIETDIEDNKAQIINYVMGLVNATLPQSTLNAPYATVEMNTQDLSLTRAPRQVLVPEHTPPEQTQHTPDWNRRLKFLANLDQYSLYSQQIGRATVQFKVQKFEHGLIYSQPATLVIFDIWLRSTVDYSLVSAHFWMRIKPAPSKLAYLQTSDSPPIIVAIGPSWMGRSYRSQDNPTIHSPVEIGSAVEDWSKPVIIEGENINIGQRSKQIAWTIDSVMSPGNRREVEWHIRSSQNGSPLNVHTRLALIVERGARYFDIEIERAGSLKSGFRRLISRSVRSVDSIRIDSDDITEPAFDKQNDLEVVHNILEAQTGLEMGEEVGLEYNGKSYMKRYPLTGEEARSSRYNYNSLS